MTLVAVSIAPDSPDDIHDAIRRAVRSVKQGADLIEWRIDRIAEEPNAIELVDRLLRESPRPSIVTCRPTWEGGEYEGSDQDRISLLEAIGLLGQPPRYIDLEYAAMSRSANLRQKIGLVVQHANQARDVRTALIVSTHDFEGRPSDLTRRVNAIADEPSCAVVKVAWRARSLRDNLEAFDLLRHRRRPTIALCMGPFGTMSRVLTPKFGGLLTFAAAERDLATAPGQPTVEDLFETYRLRRLGALTKVYGVIGWPVEHSRGVLIHNAGFEAVGHDGVYLPMPIAPEWEQFKATVDAMIQERSLDFRGASVTLPHKEHLLRFVEEMGGTVDPSASTIGAANTLTVDDGGALTCFNSDASAAVATLVEDAGVDHATLSDARVAIIGAGGAARAVAAGVAASGASVVVFARRDEQAEALAADLSRRSADAGAPIDVVAGRMDALSSGRFQIVVNCTPIGMTGGPEPEGSPLPDDFRYEGVTIFDTVYTPQETVLLRAARERNAAIAIGGLGMFLRQAAMQFEAWTGRPAPVGTWRSVLGAAETMRNAR